MVSKIPPLGCGPREEFDLRWSVSSSLNTLIYSALSGFGQAMVVPWASKETMRIHLKQIADITDPDRHAVVIMDGAGWHTDDIAAEFDNVSIIKLPQYSPELNSIEQVWSWMRQHCLANRAFKHYEDMVDSVCTAWNRFTESAEWVTKMCSRDWASLIS